MVFQLMKVFNYLCCETEITFIATKVVSIVVVLYSSFAYISDVCNMSGGKLMLANNLPGDWF